MPGRGAAAATATTAAAITTTATATLKREIFLLFTPRVFHDYFATQPESHTCTAVTVVGDRAVAKPTRSRNAIF